MNKDELHKMWEESANRNAPKPKTPKVDPFVLTGPAEKNTSKTDPYVSVGPKEKPPLQDKIYKK